MFILISINSILNSKVLFIFNSTLRSYNNLNLNDLAYNPQKPPPAPSLKKEGKNNKIVIFPSFDKEGQGWLTT